MYETLSSSERLVLISVLSLDLSSVRSVENIPNTFINKRYLYNYACLPWLPGVTLHLLANGMFTDCDIDQPFVLTCL